MTESPSQPEVPPQSEAAPQAGPAPEAAPSPEAATIPPDALSLVITCLNLLAAKAWEAMGLVPNPSTGKIERKLDEAQLAIDAAASLADLVRPRLADGARREVETLIANLRINFVEQKSRTT
ncbi:MAG: DUF1844 domain-containing protein [Armatimonadota bacterium]|nr:DUF1844 domain-containing protein [Armatimonadota bacterium]MDR7519867.1 DUF1844 domain-containing protein [Armatimonadota bacterium]MDR7551284.1 DUF1844 domain-containing protein [Armatimonadota bacterium]